MKLRGRYNDEHNNEHVDEGRRRHNARLRAKGRSLELGEGGVRGRAEG